VWPRPLCPEKGQDMRYKTGAALIVLAGILWSVQGLIIRNIHEAGPWAILFWRSAGMLPVLLVWIWLGAKGRAVAEMRSVGWPGVWGGLGLVAAFSGAIYAFQTTTVANAVLLFSASPFFAAILGRVLLGERVSLVTWLAIGLAALGILVMVGGGIGGGAMDGNIAAVLSALGFAIFTITLRWGKLANMLPSVALGGVFSMLAGSIVGVILQQTLAIPLRDAAIAAAMGAVTLSGGMLLYTLGSRVVPAAQATLLSLIEVLLAPVWVWLFLGETVSQGTLIGGAVLLAAVLLNAYGGKLAPAEALPESLM
jgi:drug/metabolite transporter, DME family